MGFLLNFCTNWFTIEGQLRADNARLGCLLQGEFSLEGRFPEVRDNVVLVQGLFNESLPGFIKKYYRNRNPLDITYLHIDCDLYAGKQLQC